VVLFTTAIVNFGEMNSRKRKRTSLSSIELSAYRDQHFKVACCIVCMLLKRGTGYHRLRLPSGAVYLADRALLKISRRA